MKFIATWKIPPGSHRPAAEGFLKGGAPAPDGIEILGRWHAPGSVRGWVLIEGADMTALSQHIAEWGNYLELDVTPVVEDEVAAESLARAYANLTTPAP